MLNNTISNTDIKTIFAERLRTIIYQCRYGLGKSYKNYRLAWQMPIKACANKKAFKKHIFCIFILKCKTHLEFEHFTTMRMKLWCGFDVWISHALTQNGII